MTRMAPIAREFNTGKTSLGGQTPPAESRAQLVTDFQLGAHEPFTTTSTIRRSLYLRLEYQPRTTASTGNIGADDRNACGSRDCGLS